MRQRPGLFTLLTDSYASAASDGVCRSTPDLGLPAERPCAELDDETAGPARMKGPRPHPRRPGRSRRAGAGFDPSAGAALVATTVCGQEVWRAAKARLSRLLRRRTSSGRTAVAAMAITHTNDSTPLACRNLRRPSRLVHTRCIAISSYTAAPHHLRAWAHHSGASVTWRRSGVRRE